MSIKVFSKDGKFFEHYAPSEILLKLGDYFLYHDPYYIPVSKNFTTSDKKKVVDEFMKKIDYIIVGRIEHKVFKVQKDGQIFVMKKIDFCHAQELELHLLNISGKVELLDYWFNSRGITLIFPFYNSDLFSYLVTKGNKLTDQQIHGIIKQIAEALLSFHSLNIVYGDLKPENILVTENAETVKICDLGLCKYAGYKCTPAGSYEYMPPELNTNHDVKYEKSVDIWSFGTLISNMFHRGEYATFGSDGRFTERTMRIKPYLPENAPNIYKNLFAQIFTVAEKRPTIEEIIQQLELF